MLRTVSTRPMRVIAITGTSGKTTTAWLTAAVLAEGGLQVGVLSDLGCLGPDAEAPRVSNYRTAEGLAGWLGRLAATGCTHAIVEVSNRMLARDVLAGVAVDTLVVTNMAGSPSGGPRTRHISRAAESLRPGGWLVSGCDAAAEAELTSRLPVDAFCLTAGLAERCDLRATPVEGSLFGRTVLVSRNGQLMPLSLDPPVVPFVRDSLLAAGVGLRYGLTLELAVRGLESAGAVPGRVERLDRGQDPAIFMDSPTTGHALAATLASLRRLTRGRLVVMAEADLVARLGGRGFGRLIARHCDASVVTPATVLADDPASGDVAAYARIDRLLDSLTADDCCLLLGGISPPGGPAGPPGGGFPLVSLVDAWLRLALDPADPCRRRAA